MIHTVMLHGAGQPVWCNMLLAQDMTCLLWLPQYIHFLGSQTVCNEASQIMARPCVTMEAAKDLKMLGGLGIQASQPLECKHI